MKSVFKYVIDTIPNVIGAPKGVYTIELPLGSKVLFGGIQNKTDLCIWAEVDPSISNSVPVEIYVLGTGWPVIEGIKYLNTVMIEDGVFVYHLYVKDQM